MGIQPGAADADDVRVTVDPRPRWITAALAGGAAAVVLYVLWALLAAPDGDALSVGRVALYTVVSFGAVILVGARALGPATGLRAGERAAWVLLGGSLLLWAVGDLGTTLAFGADLPSRSFGDVLWFVGYVPLVAGLVLLGRGQRRSWRSGLWLDGAAGALTLAALGAMVVLEPVRRVADGDALDVAVTLGYPACDVLVIAALVATTALQEWRLERRWLLLAGGVLGFAVGDALDALEVARGSYVDGDVLDVTWLLMSLCFAAAAWTSPRELSRRSSGRAVVLAPALVGAGALAVLLVDASDGMGAVTVPLASAALLAVLARSALAIADTQRVLAQARVEASTDALTTLGNRRRLMGDLQRHVDAQASKVLVLLDLDGFKRFNDSRGHEAGDRLLARIGTVLADLARSVGAAYRLGGDEFCVLLPAEDEDEALRLTGGVRAAVAQVGAPDGVGVSAGHACLPQEAWDPATALRVADVRMYAVKHAGAGQGEPQPAADR